MRFENLDFYYFSGTGNTLLVVRKMQEVFQQHGVNVSLHRIEASSPPQVAPQHAVGLGFPVAEQGTYPFIWDFIKALPSADGTPIFMVDTMMAFSGGIVGPVRTIVKKKGYTPIGALEIIMPNNLFPKKIDAQKNAAKQQKGLEKAEHYAAALLEERSSWGRVPLFSDFMGIFSQAEWAWNFLRKGYKLDIDRELCSQCGLCAKLCPVGNIVMNEFPEYKTNCCICMRCVAFCPTKAIYATKAHFASHKKDSEYYKVVKASELLSGNTR